MILYEYPFNERIRTYLRLEHLFRRLGELIARSHALDHHFALTTVFEIMDVAARADLKSDVLKDIEKQKHVLDGYRGNPAISEAALDAVIEPIVRSPAVQLPFPPTLERLYDVIEIRRSWHFDVAVRLY